MGKNVYQSREQAEADVKRFAKKIRIRAPQEKPSEAACQRPNVVENDRRGIQSKLLLHGLLRGLQIFFRAEQLLQLLDALTLDVRRGRRSRLRLRYARRQQQERQHQPEGDL